jgi:hypothetical protein
VEAKAWQAFSATLLLERSKFGLNELLGCVPSGKKPIDQQGSNAKDWQQREPPVGKNGCRGRAKKRRLAAMTEVPGYEPREPQLSN